VARAQRTKAKRDAESRRTGPTRRRPKKSAKGKRTEERTSHEKNTEVGQQTFMRREAPQRRTVSPVNRVTLTAILIAISPSVTVSIGLEMKGVRRVTFRVMRVSAVTSEAAKSILPGERSRMKGDGCYLWIFSMWYRDLPGRSKKSL
jgi:hypothetical protein